MYKLECTTRFDEEGERPLTCSLSFNAQKIQHDNTLGKEFPNSQMSYDIKNIKPIQPFIITHQLLSLDPQSFTINFNNKSSFKFIPNKKYFIEFTVVCHVPSAKHNVTLKILNIAFALDAKFDGKILCSESISPCVELSKERSYRFVVGLCTNGVFSTNSMGTISIKWSRAASSEVCEFRSQLPSCECMSSLIVAEIVAPRVAKQNEFFGVNIKMVNMTDTIQYLSMYFDEASLTNNFFFAGDYNIAFSIQPYKQKVIQQYYLPLTAGNNILPSFELLMTNESNESSKIISKEYSQSIWINP